LERDVTDLKELFDDLIRFEIELWSAIDARLRLEHELQLTWFEPMQVIARREACRVNDIAESLSITIGGTSKLVDRIEESGYCVRRPNPDDRRSSIIELSPSGRRLLDAATETFEAELERRLGSVLDADALNSFAGSLATLRRARERHAREEVDVAVRELTRSR
jgi:MarR family transcriptional regulator, organic hydroperoxide resistance regulator